MLFHPALTMLLTVDARGPPPSHLLFSYSTWPGHALESVVPFAGPGTFQRALSANFGFEPGPEPAIPHTSTRRSTTCCCPPYGALPCSWDNTQVGLFFPFFSAWNAQIGGR